MKRFFAHMAAAITRIHESKNLVRVVGVLAGVFALFVIPHPAQAADLANSPIFGWISHILFGAAYMLGKVTEVLFGILVQVAQYNDFIHAQAVTVGWRILRDIANMLFILVLLVIAFGTAFRIQQYRYTALLRQLIVMAVLINFSNLITALFIDLTQVIMMTFVNAFADTAAGNLTTALGLDKVLAINPASGEQITGLAIAATLAIGVVMMAAMCIVTILYVIIFLARILFLWILIILSPLAYLFATFPSTKRYWSEWWTKFWQYAAIGPILAFFLWLTLTITAAGNAAMLISIKTGNQNTFEGGGSGTITAAISQISSEGGILSFLVAIMLLILSLKIATDFSVAGGSFAQRSFDKAQKGFTRRVQRGATAPLRGAAALAGRGAEAAAFPVAGALARSRVPVLNNWGARQQSRLEERRKKRDDARAAWVAHVKDNRVLARLANASPILPAGKAQKKAARNLAPATISPGNYRDMVTHLASMEPADIAKLPASQLYDIAKRMEDEGHEKLHDVAPNAAEQVLRSGSLQKLRALGYADAAGHRWRYDRATNAFVSPGVNTPADETAVPSRDPSNPDRYKPNSYFADIDERAFEATKKAIQQQRGSADAFYQSPKYLANKNQYLNQEDFTETL
ncbi:MAG: hypothetical protein V1778_05060, partial [bacterium]